MHLSRFSRRRLLAGLGGLALVVLIPVGIAMATGGPPIANDDPNYHTDPGVTLVVSAPGVLANDTDAEDAVTAVPIVGGATSHGGTVDLLSDGSFTYVPPAAFVGTDTFTYDANDGSQNSASPATVTITVDTRPVGVSDSYPTPEDTALVQNVLGNDTDADNPGASQTLTVSAHTGPTHGTLSIATNGSFTYTPVPDYNGPDSFTYTVNDGLLDATAATTVNLTIDPVNDPPTFTSGGNVTVNEDSGAHDASWATAISKGATNESAQTLTFGITANDNTALFSAQPEIDAVSGNLSFTPVTDAHGVAHLTVELQDNGGGSDTSAPASFTITVNSVNDAPSFTNGGPDVVLEDNGPRTVPAWAIDISAGPTNESGQVLTFNVTGDTNAALFSVLPAVNATTGDLTYTPAANANGSANITLTLSDDGGTANGGADTSAPASFTITVTAVNDAPSFTVGADQTPSEDSGAQTVVGWATNISDGPLETGQILTFNVSNDNNALFSTQPAISPTGALTYTPAPNANGTTTVTVSLHDNGGGTDTSAPQTFTITVTPVNDPPSFTKGADQTVNEDSGPVSITTWATNISAGPTDETGQILTFNVTGDTNAALFSVLPAVNATTGDLTYTPAANANGSATITLTLSDNGGGTDTSAPASFTITVTPVNDPPSFTKGADQTVNEDSGPVSVTTWATNISPGPADEATAGQAVGFIVTNDNNALFSFSGQPAVASNGTLTFTPTGNANGSATVTVSAFDNGSGTPPNDNTSAPQTFTITVTPVNDPPSFTKGADQTVNEDATAQSVSGWATGMSAGPPDEAGQSLNFMVTNDNNGLFSVQPAVSPGGTLTYTPLADANGTAIVSVSLHDSGGTSNGGVDTSGPQTFTITLNPVNDKPTFTLDPTTITVLEDSGPGSDPGRASNFNPGPPDESGQGLLNYQVSNDDNALFLVQPAISNAGTLTFTPAADAFGTTIVTVRARDNGGVANGGVDTSDPQTFSITITAVNDAPSFTVGGNQSILEDTGAHTVPTWATAISAGPGEGTQTLTFHVTGNTNPGLFLVAPAVAPNGTLGYTLNANAVGASTITLTLQDNGGTLNGGVDTSAPQTFTITITGINDPPSFDIGPGQTVNEDAGPQSVSGWATAMSAGPPDESGQTLSFQVTADTNAALFSTLPAVAANGALSYTSAPDAFGSADVTIVLKDNGGTANGGDDTSAPQTFTITVDPVNDAPSFTKGPNQSVLEDSGAHTAAGWATGFDPGPANEASQVVADYVVSNNNNALFSVQPDVANNGQLTFTPAANQNGTATVTVQVRDNGGTANGGVDLSVAQTFTITVTAVNDAPSFTKGADEAVLEDTGAHTVATWATAISPGPSDETGQAVSFVVSNDDNSLFSVQPNVDGTTGDLTYTLASNGFGSATVTVTAVDNGGTLNGGVDTSAPQTFTITVTNVNDAPSFTSGGNVADLEDVVHSAAWATGISAGPGEGGVQTVDYIVTGNTNAGLFDVGPAVAPDGTLSWSPAANANGTADITVELHDSGGTLNGGVDTSAPVTFTITVTPVNDAPTFTLDNAPITVAEDSHNTAGTIFSKANVGTGFDPGPPDESTQTLADWVVTNTNTGMFAQQPDIDNVTGALTFRTASNRNGVATVTVKAKDNGGTANGGADTSAGQTLTITITPVNDPPGANDDVASVLTNSNSNTINVLANDLAGPPDEQTGGANAQTLKVLTKTNGAHGTVTITNGGALVDYVPAANFTGSDTFTYTVCDAATCPPGLTSAPATVFVTVTPSVTRLAGSDRYATGVAITRNFSGNGPVVYVATGANFPDALAGAAAAGHFDAPLVLLPGTASSIPTIVQDELTRLAPAKIVVLGSSGAINDTIFAQLHSYAATVVRVFGSSRYETAIAISQDTYPTPAVSPPVHLVQEVWIATGRNFPDALAAAAVAGRDDAPLLLVDGLATGLTGTANAAVKTELQRLNPVTVRIAGSAGVVSQGIQNALNTMFGSGNVHRYGGSNRYQTATLISGAMFAHPLAPGATMYVATGVNFPDALAGAALAGHEGAPLLLVPGTSSSINGYPSIGQELTALKPARIIIFGSSGAVSTGIFNQLVGYTGL